MNWDFLSTFLIIYFCLIILHSFFF